MQPTGKRKQHYDWKAVYVPSGLPSVGFPQQSTREFDAAVRLVLH